MLNPVILLDIDGTITRDRNVPQIGPGFLLHNRLFDVLLEVAEQHGLDSAESRRRITEYAESRVFWDYPEFISLLGLNPEPVLTAWRSWHREHLAVFDDAVRFVRSLDRDRHRLFIQSNNPRFGCLMKLEAAGLAEDGETSFFEGIGCANLGRGQKHDPDFWTRTLAGLELDPEEVTMIGDDPHEDVDVPHQAGIRSFILLNRDGAETAGTVPARVVTNLEEIIRDEPDSFSGPGRKEPAYE